MTQQEMFAQRMRTLLEERELIRKVDFIAAATRAKLAPHTAESALRDLLSTREIPQNKLADALQSHLGILDL
tara:strand:+ start:1956 stop:2171 length:216 start_codon:yes stop_codon:yes gene_type:complete